MKCKFCNKDVILSPYSNHYCENVDRYIFENEIIKDDDNDDDDTSFPLGSIIGSVIDSIGTDDSISSPDPASAAPDTPDFGGGDFGGGGASSDF